MRAVALLVLVGCGRVSFDPLAAIDANRDASDASGDGFVDTPCWAAWRSGNPQLTAPVAASTINGVSSQDTNPFVMADGLTLYFVSDRSGGGHSHIWGATRPTTTGQFNVVGTEASLSSASNDENSVQLMPDGLTAFFASNRLPGQGQDLWVGTRSSATAPFTVSKVVTANLNTAEDEYDPQPMHGGLRLYFSRGTGVSNQDVYMADRPSLAAPFDPAVLIPGVSTVNFEADPYVSPDELAIVYSAIRGGQSRRIYVATRSSTASAFGNERELTVTTAGASDNEDPVVTADGCELWSVSTRTGGFDIYMSQVIP